MQKVHKRDANMENGASDSHDSQAAAARFDFFAASTLWDCPGLGRKMLKRSIFFR
jgi:hypothetical protein